MAERIREAPSRSTRGSKASRKRWPTVPRRRRIEPATGACRAPPRAKRPAKSRCAILGSFHFHHLAFRRCEIPRLIHRLDTRGTYPEAARGHNLQQVDIRSEEHTSELQSRPHLVCRLLLEKKKADG